MGTAFSHTPVMLEEVMRYLLPKVDGIYIDGTFGRGGYTEAFLKAGSRVIGLDRDPEAIAASAQLVNIYKEHLIMVQGCFGDIESILQTHAIKQVDGIVLDLGVSSPQLDDAARGFSFRFEGPLDMRMDPTSSLTAAFVVNTYDEEALANIFYYLGEERYSRRVAKAILKGRAIAPLETTSQLARLVRSVVKPSKDGLDPATRCFQALRLYVNDELGQLQTFLQASLNILKPGGRMVIVTFHSLEDRFVKRFFRDHSARSPRPSRHAFPQPKISEPIFHLLTSKAIRPSVKECQLNPRATSAKLRAIERLLTPASQEGSTLCHA